MKPGLGLSLNRNNTNIGSSYSTTYVNNLISQATIDGYTIPSANTLAALDIMMQSLIDNSIDTKLDALWILSTDGDRNFAKYNVLNPTSYYMTEGVAPTFTSKQGFKGNGTSMYLNTNFNPVTHGVNYTLNSASIGVWQGTNTAETKHIVGCVDGSSNTIGSIWNRGGALSSFWTVNAPNTGKGVSHLTTTGLNWMNRPGASSLALYSNASIHQSFLEVSSGVPNLPIYVLARNNSGTPDFFSINQVSIAFVGGDLSSKATDFYNAVNTYMTSL